MSAAMSCAGVARYREVAATTRVLSASGPALTAVLYAELADTLCLTRRAGQLATAGTKALAILASLDAGLGGSVPANDGDFATQMRAIHRFAAQRIERSLRENDPIWCQAALAEISPIADAWASVRSNP